jgi:hypothetical protein
MEGGGAKGWSNRTGGMCGNLKQDLQDNLNILQQRTVTVGVLLIAYFMSEVER